MVITTHGQLYSWYVRAIVLRRTHELNLSIL
jgi:hypothetical protein